MSAEDALKKFEIDNNIVIEDALYTLDVDQQRDLIHSKPWKKDPHYFAKVKISAIALVKMVMHAQSGGDLEIMGMMQGKIMEDTMVVMDAFALPVEGTETRVNAQAEAYEYMVQYQTNCKPVNRLENVIGWYHSHPGYGCWLSGIDVSTQKLNQEYQEPFVAIVVDPKRTMSAGKVEIGAFRTYPKDYKPASSTGHRVAQAIPVDKVEDFGVHVNEYYPLQVSCFKSSTDHVLLNALWNKYWINTLSASPLNAVESSSPFPLNFIHFTHHILLHGPIMAWSLEQGLSYPPNQRFDKEIDRHCTFKIHQIRYNLHDARPRHINKPYDTHPFLKDCKGR